MAKRLTKSDVETGYGAHVDPRREKRHFRKLGMSDPLYLAHTEGEAAAMYGRRMPKRLQTNPYRPGARRDEWQRSYDLADPLGDFHGRNR